MNFSFLCGRPLTIIPLKNYPGWVNSNLAKIVIENLDGQLDIRSIYDTFMAFGDVVTCMVRVHMYI